MIKNLFAGYLDLNPLMYVWDQYMITIDVAGFHDEMIPVFVSIILMILRDQIMAVKDVKNFEFFNLFRKKRFNNKSLDWRI
jgi:hypothetical protein